MSTEIPVGKTTPDPVATRLGRFVGGMLVVFIGVPAILAGFGGIVYVIVLLVDKISGAASCG